MNERRLRNYDIVPPKQTSGAVATEPDQLELPALVILCGRFRSGKTVAAVNLLRMLPFDRIFWVGSSYLSNKRMLDGLPIEPEDVFTDSDDLSVIEKISAAVQEEADDLVRYEKEMRRYGQMMKRLQDGSSITFMQDDDLLSFFDSGRDMFAPPRHKWGGRRPVMAVAFDDCLGSLLFSKPRKLNKLCTGIRHLGAFEDGRPALGVSVFFTVQSLKCQVGGLTKTIRLQCTQYVLFRTHNETEIESIWEQCAGDCTKEDFFRVYKHAIEGDPSASHPFLMVDLNRKPCHHSMFRRCFNTYLLL